MPDGTDQPHGEQSLEEKLTLTPKEVPKPTPICTVMSDRSLRLDASSSVNLLEVHGLLLSAAAGLTMDVARRGLAAESILASIGRRFDGLDPDTLAQINAITRGGG